MSYESVDLGGTPVVATTPVVAGPRGPRGPSGVVLIEANQTEPVEDTPVDTIVYRKLN